MAPRRIRSPNSGGARPPPGYTPPASTRCSASPQSDYRLLASGASAACLRRCAGVFFGSRVCKVRPWHRATEIGKIGSAVRPAERGQCAHHGVGRTSADRQRRQQGTGNRAEREARRNLDRQWWGVPVGSAGRRGKPTASRWFCPATKSRSQRCEMTWEIITLSARGPRVRRYPSRRRSPTRSVAAVNASAPPAGGPRSPRPSATRCASSARGSATATSPPGFGLSAHRAIPPQPRLRQTWAQLTRAAGPGSSPPCLIVLRCQPGLKRFL